MTNLKDDARPIDFERLREVAADDTELINEILELYFSQTHEMLDEIKSAIAVGDAERIYRAAHKVLGSSATCGMDAVVPAFRELEQAGKSGNLENTQSFLNEAEQRFDELKNYLQENKENFLS